ncbi:hypothetical protein AWC15_11975 [Mycobacterium lacus]|nr:hypothetical protein AWC15_11975 [Mycobacterium lacus]
MEVRAERVCRLAALRALIRAGLREGTDLAGIGSAVNTGAHTGLGQHPALSAAGGEVCVSCPTQSTQPRASRAARRPGPSR